MNQNITVTCCLDKDTFLLECDTIEYEYHADTAELFIINRCEGDEGLKTDLTNVMGEAIEEAISSYLSNSKVSKTKTIERE